MRDTKTSLWMASRSFDLRFGSLLTGEKGARLGRACKVCGRHLFYTPGKLDGEWNTERAKPKELGTFTWGGRGSLILVDDLAETLAARFRGLRTDHVKIRGRFRLEGDDSLTQLDTSIKVEPAPQSTIERTNTCDTCGRSSLKLLGVGPFQFKRIKGEFRQLPVPRKPGHGLFIDERELEGVGLFACMELLYCTDAFRQMVVDFGATNIVFGEVGETFRSRAAAKKKK